MIQERRTALVTGASGGIGRELACLFAADGYDLVLLARREHELAEAAAELSRTCGIQATVLPYDLCDPAAPAAIYGILQERGIVIDALVNNAGYGLHGVFAEIDLTQQLDLLQINVMALTHLTRLLLPGMMTRGRGEILNLGSTGSFAPTPLMAVYGASKAYVLSFTQALAAEVRGTGVRVTALCPGMTRTGFQDRAGVQNTLLARIGVMDARRVAAAGYRALRRGRVVVVPGWFNKVMVLGIKLLPGALIRWISHVALR